MRQTLPANERRKHPRYATNQVFLAANAHFGVVENISLGGLSFKFIDRGCWKQRPDITAVLFGEDDQWIDDLPIKELGLQTLHHENNEWIKKTRFKFRQLSSKQQRLIQSFIQGNAVKLPASADSSTSR